MIFILVIRQPHDQEPIEHRFTVRDMIFTHAVVPSDITRVYLKDLSEFLSKYVITGSTIPVFLEKYDKNLLHISRMSFFKKILNKLPKSLPISGTISVHYEIDQTLSVTYSEGGLEYV